MVEYTYTKSYIEAIFINHFEDDLFIMATGEAKVWRLLKPNSSGHRNHIHKALMEAKLTMASVEATFIMKSQVHGSYYLLSRPELRGSLNSHMNIIA